METYCHCFGVEHGGVGVESDGTMIWMLKTEVVW